MKLLEISLCRSTVRLERRTLSCAKEGLADLAFNARKQATLGVPLGATDLALLFGLQVLDFMPIRPEDLNF